MLRFFDCLIASLLFLLFLPVFLCVVVVNRCTGEGEVFFLQTRIGKCGSEFQIIKFATMLKNSPVMGTKGFVELDDSRVLPFGKILRKTKLNEIPQLLNIIKGDMSLVGFRPFVRETYDKAMRLVKDESVYSLSPGLTSLASVVFRNEEAMLAGVENRQQVYDEQILPLKVALDVWWSKNASFRNYFLIILLTAWKVIFVNSDLHKKYFGEALQGDQW